VCVCVCVMGVVNFLSMIMVEKSKIEEICASLYILNPQCSMFTKRKRTTGYPAQQGVVLNRRSADCRGKEENNTL
jgi:hypothetical protein